MTAFKLIFTCASLSCAVALAASGCGGDDAASEQPSGGSGGSPGTGGSAAEAGTTSSGGSTADAAQTDATTQDAAEDAPADGFKEDSDSNSQTDATTQDAADDGPDASIDADDNDAADSDAAQPDDAYGEEDAGCTPSQEVCNGIDDDCNGVVDEGDPGGGADCVATAPGICSAGVEHCSNGTIKCSPSAAALEVCDGLDNNCDGTVDEGCACKAGDTQDCYSGAPGTAGVGPCKVGAAECDLSGTYGTCKGEAVPQPESCNGVDDDCKGQIDDGDPGGGAACVAEAFGVCAQGIEHCTDGVIRCTPGTPGAEECDGLDNDCDGTADDGNPGGGLQCQTGLPGICSQGISECGGANGVTCQPVASPGQVPEACNGLDDDCDGVTDETCPSSCLAIKLADATAQSGYYFIDVDGVGPGVAFEVWCDMTTEGGGWTRFYWLGGPYPTGVDPFGKEVSGCSKTDVTCLAGIPKSVEPAELLVKDLGDNAYAAWRFDPTNAVSNAVLAGLRDRTRQCVVNGAAAFMPYVNTSIEGYCGTGIEGGCDSFYYTDATCGSKTRTGWGTNFDGDGGCYGSAFKAGMVNSSDCCGCPLSADDWAFLNYSQTQNELGELYWRESSAVTCKTLRDADPSALSGVYSVDPDGLGGSAPFQAWCDMVFDGGGWMSVYNQPKESVTTAAGMYSAITQRAAMMAPATPTSNSGAILTAGLPLDRFTEIAFGWAPKDSTVTRWAYQKRASLKGACFVDGYCGNDVILGDFTLQPQNIVKTLETGDVPSYPHVGIGWSNQQILWGYDSNQTAYSNWANVVASVCCNAGNDEQVMADGWRYVVYIR